MCNRGQMLPFVVSMPVTVDGVLVLVPGVRAFRCDRCGELEYDGPETDRAVDIARLMLAQRVA